MPADRVEEDGEARGHVELGERAVGPLPARPPSLARPSRPASPSRRTAVTATCSAASSPSVSSSSGR